MVNIIEDQLEIKQQIVTYKFLTRKLNIHPNEAKKMLQDYVDSLVDDTKYSITFIIGGVLKENDEFCMIIAYDDHLETIRRRFKLINFEHIYSIQPVKRFDDINNALYLIDSSIDNYVTLPSSIKKKEKQIISIPEQNNEIEKEIDLSSAAEINLTATKVPNHSNETEVDTILDKTQKKKTGMDLFVNKSKNAKIKEKEKKVSSKNTHSLFSNNFQKSNNSDNIKTISDNEILTENLPKNNIKIDDEPSKKNINEHETKIKKKVNKKDSGKKKKSSQNIKRKRIQTFDSSDEEIDSEEEDKKKSENVLEVEDEIDLVQPTPPRSTVRENRKKEKQITTSTFVDDEGFICTTKEVNIVETVCEPSSKTDVIVEDAKLKEFNSEPSKKKMKLDESGHIDKKKNKTKQPKLSSNQGMKQSSLNSFFFKQNK
ncbi:DNA polymerase delta subunit 3-like [Sipha flava]|uniref:DNA polymerase delta subunit 3 n=1 Tax=Sipha flava TaxID=143950 RepID=A0A8B8F3I2_9HEMI|nr:DNA polymerase delta subunit 3-like [Sipha flava]